MLNHGQVVRLLFGLKLREPRQERCPIPDCKSRAAAPTEIVRQAERAAFEAALQGGS